MIATIIEQAAQIAADGALKSFVILAVAGLVVTAWRKSSASSRHLVWTAGVVAAIAVPLLTAVLPQWRSNTVAVALPASSPLTLKQSIEPAELTPAPPASEAASTPIVHASEGMISISEPFVEAGVTPIPSAPENVTTEASSPVNLVTLAAIVWMSVAAMILLPFVIGRIRLLRIARTSHRVTDMRWVQLLSRARASGRFTRRITLLVSDDAAMPMTWGILSPVLLLPSNTAEWPEWKCRNILLHELAHIERFDCLTQFVARVACALYWFNPLVWIAAHRMQVEREMACDDRVINNGSLASDYAGQLLDVARSLRPARATAHAAIAMARPSQLSGRLTAVLDRARNRSFVTRKLQAAIGAATLTVALPVASFTPWTSTAEASTIVHASMVPSEVGISPAVGMAATDSVRKDSLPPTTLTSKLADDLTALSKKLTLLAERRSFAGTGAAFPTIQSVQSSNAVPALASTNVSTQAAGCWETRKDQSSSVNINSDDSRNSRTTVKFSSGDCSLELRSDGQFRMRPDLSDVEWIENGGQITIEERDGRFSRRVEIRSTGGGLDRAYYENGQRKEWDNSARAWLASTLMAVERRTAFAASTRVPQIYAARGAKGVMDEVSQMPSDYAKSAYLSVLLKQNELDAGTLTRIVQQASREMTSDYYLAEVFTKVGAQRQADEGTWRAFADATRDMKSDYYKAEVIGKVLSRDRLDSQTIGTLLTAASTINSDYYQAETLKKLSRRQPINAQTRPIYLAALSKITSDYYKGEVLSTLSSADRYDAATTAVILKAIGEMKSDYYKEQSLVTLFKRTQLDASTRPQYFSTVRSIDSDYYKQQALDAALDESPLTRETVAAVLAAAPSIKSDAYLSSLLSEVARRYTIDDNLRPAFDRAVDAINSDYYRGSVLSAARRSTR
ncbi:MAG TPA: M56 family metallopeptidase [Gemmatimonadaceae bacterium]|nr:M56 family metallopeptidase [Gemmatimonadaceae bacterium]